MFRRRPQTLPQPIGIVDVGTDSIGAALMVPRSPATPTCTHLIYADRQPLPFPEALHPERLRRAWSDGVRTALERLLRSDRGRPGHYHVFLPTPCYESRTKTITVERDRPFAVTTGLRDDLLEKELRALATQHPEGELLESAILRETVGGYPVPDASEHRTTAFGFTHFASWADTDLVRDIREAVHAATHDDRVTLHSTSYALYRVLNALLPDERSYMALDVRGELSELVVTTNGILVATASFPNGSRSLIRALAAALHTSIPEAVSKLTLRYHDRLDAAERSRLDAALNEERKRWSASFRDTLLGVLESGFPSRHIILLAPNGFGPVYAEWIRRLESDDIIPRLGTFTLHDFSLLSFQHFCHFAIDVPPDPLLMLDALFCDTLDDTRT